MDQIQINKEKAKNLTAKVAHQIREFRYENMPEELLARGRQVLIDGIAVAVAGAKQEEPSRILAANAKEYGGYEQASVIGLGCARKTKIIANGEMTRIFFCMEKATFVESTGLKL